MIKSIQIDSHSVELNGSMGWLFVYRAQFGRDILPDLMPIIDTLLTIAGNAINEKGEVTPQSIVQSFDEGDMGSALISLSGLEVMTLLNIIWAMAKNADKSIDSPEEWFGKFENFPLDVIVPEVFRLIFESCVSTKNSKRLQRIIAKAKS